MCCPFSLWLVCQLDFKCTRLNSGCTTGEWLNITNQATVATDVCPYLQPNSDASGGKYTQPVTVAKNLTISTINTPFLPGLSYECVYGTDTRAATVSSDNRVTCINNPVLTIGGGGSTQNVLLSLRQVYNGNRYTIETNATANLNVILYNCPTLALGCSSCLAQRIGTGFNCSWCNSNTQCRDISDCSDASPVISTGNCPLPMITDFNPKAGPPSSGTIIIINGTDLGTQRSDIESVMVGNRNCIVDEYEPGVWMTCTIVPDTNDNADRNESITIRVTRSSGSVAVNSSTQYQFITPIIQSVSPTYGPVSGGTRIKIQGTNFDIGNKEMTRVIMRQSSRKKRNSCPDVNCNITSIINTEINCVTSSINDTDCVRNVIVSVNGASFSNTSISYQYRPDPTFYSISPMVTIPAGGIQLAFTGRNLNSVQSPTITITDSRLIPSSFEPCITNDIKTSLLICNGPRITNVIDSYYGTCIEYMLMLDGAESPDFTNAYLRLTLQPDPIITGINADSRSISVDDINEITIMGMNVGSVSPSEINITLGNNDDDVCTLRTSSNTEITCRPPTKPSGTRLALRVRVGRNLVFPSNGTTGPEWTLEYTSTSIESSTSTGSITSTIITTMTTTTGPTSTSTSAPSSTSIGAIVGGSIAASVIMTLLIVAIPLIIVILILQKRTKDSKEKPIPHEGNVVMPMSMNIYQGITSQDSNLLPQSNPAYVKASDIHKTPAGKNEEFVSVKKANNDDDDDANQVNQEDQDNEGHIDTGVIDDIAQSSEDKGSYKNIPK